MSETDDNSNQSYTVTLNETKYELNQAARQRIQRRAEHEYAENHLFSCWWKTASESDADESEIHEAGDPILVIETEGVMVPWERLDQLELEEQTTDAFGEMDTGSNDMKKTAVDGEDDREKERAHFGVTPQEFEEVPSPEGEDADKIPAKPESFDEPNMVVFVPDNPDVEHKWDAGEAMTAMHNWVEWNVQAKANQPTDENDDRHTHWESLLQADDCAEVGTVEPDESDDILDNVEEGGQSDKDVPDRFINGTANGNNWNV